MVNLNLIDMGSPIYGDVSAVFAQKYILNSTLLSQWENFKLVCAPLVYVMNVQFLLTWLLGTLLSPTDTGLYEMGCLDKTVVPVEVAYNCSALTGFKQLNPRTRSLKP